MKRGVDLFGHALVFQLDGTQLLPDRGDGSLDARPLQRSRRVGGYLRVAAKTLLVEAQLVLEPAARRLELAQSGEPVRAARVRGQLGAEFLDDHRSAPRRLL